MVDRLHPGAGINSFLRDNSILNNFKSTGGPVPIDKVASSGSSTGTSISPTVPVTEYDQISVVKKPTGTVALDEVTQSTTANINSSQTGTVSGSMSGSTTGSVSGSSTGTMTVTDAGSDADTTDVNVDTVTESETFCPCREQYSIKDNPLVNAGKSAVNNVSDVVKKFVQKDTFKASRQPRNTLEKIDSVATDVKTALTGAEKSDSEKTVVEGFCDEHWHGVAISIIIVIVILSLTITAMVFMGVIKICVPSGKKSNVNISPYDDVDPYDSFNGGVSLSGGGDIF